MCLIAASPLCRVSKSAKVNFLSVFYNDFNVTRDYPVMDGLTG